MSCLKASFCALLILGSALAGVKDNELPAKQNSKKPTDLVVSIPKSRVDLTQVPLSFEPNRGQTEPNALFIGKSHAYTVKLDAAGASFQFSTPGKGSDSVRPDVVKPDVVRMDLDHANPAAKLQGESALLGKADYFPTGDPKTWITNVPMYQRVHYSGVYPGVDVSFYGSANRLEYDFIVQPGSDAGKIRMKMSGSESPSVSQAGDLVLPFGKRQLHFLKPVAYQMSRDGKNRELVDATYELSRNTSGKAVVSFLLGQYDHNRQLVIDPVVDALSYSQYLNYYYVGALTVDSAGNSYVAGQVTQNTTAFYVDKFNTAGTLVYTAAFGTGNQAFPYALAVDGSGQAYVAGQVYTSSSTLPTTTNAFQQTAGPANQEGFLAVLSASGASLPYCTYISGADTAQSNAIAVGLDSSAKVYIGGNTNSASFPTTTGAYQGPANPSNYLLGWAAKIDPTKSGAASLIYATTLGPNNQGNATQVNRIAADYAGNAYLAVQSPAGYPTTPGAFAYTGLQSANGGAYVTKLNPTGTALVYSAYLGYGGASGIAIDAVTSGNPSVYVSGWVSEADFPTTPGAYQTSYASGFAVKLSGDGTTEIYSTFLSGPSGYTGAAVDEYPILAVPVGCASNCNAYITGRTNSPDFPAINAIQAADPSQYSAFVVELNATGSAALFSSYLGSYNSSVYRTIDSQSFGLSPTIAVDGSGNIFVAGNTTQNATNSDFPTTIPYPYGVSQAFLTKINASATAGFTLTYPTSINFGNNPIGISTPISTVRLNNYSGAAVTGLSIQVTPSNVFSESDNCAGAIPAGGFCSLNLVFTPNAPNTRNGTVTITSSASNSPTTISLTGSAYDTAYIQASPASLTFASQTVGTTSSPQTVTITNNGDQTTSISPYFPSNNNFAQTNNCPPQLAPGASCTLSVTFSPSAAGLYTPTNLAISTSNGPALYIPVSGTGVVSGAPVSLIVSGNYQFGAQPVNTTSGQENLNFTNTGSQQVAIYSFVASGPFNVLNYGSCPAPPFNLLPATSCYIAITFTPTSAGNATGTLAVNDSVSGSPQITNLSGLGVASNQVVEFNPSTALSFPDTPQGTSSGIETTYLQNTGTAPITVDRVTVTSGFTLTYSSCEGTVIPGTTIDGLGSVSVCQVNVEFTPSATATGAQTGTLTFIDNAPGSPHVVQLMGTAITATGTIADNPAALTFGAQPVGVTTGNQYIYIQNPGNTNITVTGYAFSGTNATDFSYTGSNCGTPPFTVTAGQLGCYVPVQFTPGAAGTRTATFTVSSSAGNSTTTITATGVAASQAIGITPTSFNLGSIVVGQSGTQEGMFLRNTGTETVTFTSTPSVTGANAADFSVNPNNCNNGYTVTPNSTCEAYVTFTPSVVGSESATLTFTDSAGTQTVPLSGTGVSTTPTYTLQHYLISFNTQLQNTTSTAVYTYFYNNGSTSVSLGNTTASGSFLIPSGNDTCSGQTIGAGGNCYVYVAFAPTTTGYLTGSLTFKNAGGTSLISAPLAGFSVAQTFSSFINPNSSTFTAKQVIGTQSNINTIYLYNTGNTALTVGTLSGTDLGTPGASAEFSISGTYGGYDSCSGQSVAAGSYCQVNVTFTPNAAGTRTGTIVFPVTYANNSTANLTESLTGVGVAERNSAVLTPPNGNFIDQALNVTTAYNVTVYLNNNGNQPFNVGSLTVSNSEFSTASSIGGSDSCSGVSVAIGSACQINVRFTPTSLGAQTGNIVFPVTFADHTTQNVTLPLTGRGVAATTTIAISPADLKFTTEVQGVTSPAEGIGISNTGNLPITFGSDTITTNSAEFAISYDSCTGTKLNPTTAGNNFNCSINITFTPSASATGMQTGVLTIGDNATGGPHKVTLSGIAIPASQQILLAPSTLAFGSLAAGATSTAQSIVLTNQGDNGIVFNSFTLGGTNPSDFAITYSGCSAGGTLGGHATCYALVTFNPPTGTTGSLSATITESDSGTPGTHTVSLTGTATAPGPAVTITPSSIAFPTQNVGSTSAAKSFGITNTGSASLKITSVTSSNSTEFPIYNDGCSGVTLNPNQQCSVSLQFSPTLGGTRSSSISVADNASGSPQILPVTGTGYGIPAATYTPTSLTFGNTNINSTSSAQTVVLKNTGTDTLAISGIAITGGNASEFNQTNTCPASLAPAASCNISVTFKPTASGTQSASVTVTDNASNISGSTQSVPLTGTGVAVPTGTLSPTNLTFSSTNIGVTSAAQTSILTNSGTGPLTISSIAIGGTNAGDYSQTNNCGSTLVAGSNCTISVIFDPTASGTRTATVTVTDNAGGVNGSTQTLSLTGTGTAQPGASVSPTSLTFTDQNVGTSSSAQNVTLTNSGTGALTISSIAVTGDYSTTNTCNGSVAAGGSCTIAVTFKPTTAGTRTGTLTVTDNANNVANSTQTVSISGTGVGVPTAGVSSSSLAFASTAVGSSTAAQTVTLSNSGTAPLTITSISLAGTDPGDYSDTTTCGSSVAAGSSCTISVSFAPTAAGSRPASLQIIDNSGNAGASQTVTLTGTGLVPVGSVSPASLSFGSISVGSSSSTSNVTLTNTGGATLNIASIAIGGTNSGDFSDTTTCGTTLTAGSNCTVTVKFTPTTTGSRSATLTITDNSNATSNSTQNVSLSGTGTGTSQAALTPNPTAFGNENVGTPSAAQFVTLTNSGSGTLTISAQASISGTNAADFSITSNGCGSTVAAGANCSIHVRFTPSVLGSETATLSVTDNSGGVSGTTQSISLTGTGTGPAASLSPNPVAFGNQTVHTTSNAQTVTLSNTGSSTLTISTAASVSGTNASDFVITSNSCGSTLGAGSSCSINLRFTPSTIGSETASLSVIDNSGLVAGSTQSVSLTGTGLGPTASLTPNPVAFGNEKINTTSGVQIVTLTNTGTSSLAISAQASLSGTNAGDFSITSNSCSTSLGAGANCTIHLRFTPTTIGAESATLSVTDNSGGVSGTTQTTSLTGTGTN